MPQRRGNRHPSIVPYETFEAADRPLAVAVGNDRLFARLCARSGSRELAADERFATNTARVAHADELAASGSRPSSPRAGAEWIAALTRAAVPAGPINDVARGVRAGRVARDGAGDRGRRLPAPDAAAAARRRAPARSAARRRGSTSTARSVSADAALSRALGLAAPRSASAG